MVPVNVLQVVAFVLIAVVTIAAVTADITAMTARRANLNAAARGTLEMRADATSDVISSVNPAMSPVIVPLPLVPLHPTRRMRSPAPQVKLFPTQMVLLR